ncbi:MAG: histidine kinase [Phyllobacteriaceae bacterium]|nr:histidine kinase [Phyllobacteriaceae bacterium]MBA91446.1 histidine kinase [Phyllobacteriaceae bacterium]
MPTLFRFLVTIGILAGLAYGGMFALATFVKPNKGEMQVRIPAERLKLDE